MKNKTVTVTILIQTFNEEKNILRIIRSILSQKGENFLLEKIIIADDGSTDRTVDEIKKIHDLRIVLLSDNSRKGKSARLNQMLRMVDSQVIFLIDADIHITNSYLISEVIRRTDFSTTDLVCINTVPLKGRTFFEKCINYSVKIQQEIKKKWNDGNNYLICKGACIAISSKLAKSVYIPEELVNNDCFIYFSSLKQKRTPLYFDDLFVWYRSPSSFSDHLTQTKRFQSSYNELKEYFHHPIREAYAIPKMLLVYESIKFCLKNPILFVGYCFIAIISRLHTRKVPKVKWDIAFSTKI